MLCHCVQIISAVNGGCLVVNTNMSPSTYVYRAHTATCTTPTSWDPTTNPQLWRFGYAQGDHLGCQPPDVPCVPNQPGKQAAASQAPLVVAGLMHVDPTPSSSCPAQSQQAGGRPVWGPAEQACPETQYLALMSLGWLATPALPCARFAKALNGRPATLRFRLWFIQCTVRYTLWRSAAVHCLAL